MFKATSVIHFLPSHTNYYSFLWKVTLEGNSKFEPVLLYVDALRTYPSITDGHSDEPIAFWRVLPQQEPQKI